MEKTPPKALKDLENQDATGEAVREQIKNGLARIELRLRGGSIENRVIFPCVISLHKGFSKLDRVIAPTAPVKDGRPPASAEAGKSADAKTAPVSDSAAHAATKIRARWVTQKQVLSSARNNLRWAREQATEAFNNRALSTGKRILALKIRLMATVLESVDEPDRLTVKDCVIKLHGMRSVQEIFKAQLFPGFEAAFETEERKEIIFAVYQVNYSAFRLIQVMTGDNSKAITLPALEVKEHIDVLMDERVMQALLDPAEMAEFFPGILGKEGTDDQKLEHPCRVACNSQGEFIVEDAGPRQRGIKLYSPDGKFVRRFEKSVFPSGVRSIATDAHSNVYVLAEALVDEEESNSAPTEGPVSRTNQARQVYVFNRSGIRNKKAISLGEHFWGISLAVGPSHQLFVLGLDVSKNVYHIVVHDVDWGSILNLFGGKILKSPKDMAVSSDGRVFVLTVPGTPTVQTFNTQGRHLQTFALSGTLCTEGSIGICRDCRTLVVSLWGRNYRETDKLSIYTTEGERVREKKIPSRLKGKPRAIAKDVAVTVYGRVAVIVTSTRDVQEASLQISTVWNKESTA